MRNVNKEVCVFKFSKVEMGVLLKLIRKWLRCNCMYGYVRIFFGVIVVLFFMLLIVFNFVFVCL